jgi:hypothetical protein
MYVDRHIMTLDIENSNAFLQDFAMATWFGPSIDADVNDGATTTWAADMFRPSLSPVVTGSALL